MRTPKPRTDPADLVLHFTDRLGLVFSYPLFLVEFRKDLPLNKAPSGSVRDLYILPTIKNACFSTTLMALRDINDILSRHKPRDHQHALRAYDIGFPKQSSFLTRQEREAINAIIVHSSEDEAGRTEETPFDIGELLTKGIAQSLAFLKWVEANYPEAWAAAHISLGQAELIINHIRKVNSRQVPFNTTPP